MFIDEEEDSAHTETCVFCDGIVILFKVLTGILEQMRPYIPPIKFNQWLYRVRKSEHYVNVFKGYQMRTQVTRKSWNDLKAKSSTYIAFVIFDFP